MPSDAHITAPTPSELPRYSRWKHMTDRERAAACRLTLVAWWQTRVDVVAASSYDMDGDRVIVELAVGDPCSAVAVSVIGMEAQAADVLAAVEREFGADGRAWAEREMARSA